MIDQYKKLLKPFRIISLLTTYMLGLGLVQYVREIKSGLLAVQGALFLLLVVLGFEALVLLAQIRNQVGPAAKLQERERRQLKMGLALLGATLLTAATALFVGWMVGGQLWQGWTVLVIAAVAAAVFYYLTGISRPLSPYRMLAELPVFVVIPPAMAFFIQSADFHWLLTLTLIPLTAAYLATPLLLTLKGFSKDQRYHRKTIATEIGWEKTMVFHNALILLVYLLYALLGLINYPWFLLWPVFLTLPIGILEVWLMERVRRGRKPLWKVMQVASACVYFIPMYLIGFAFWIR